MWWPLRRRERGRHAPGRVVFISASGPAEPWAPSDLALLQQAAAALDATPLPPPVEPPAPVALPPLPPVAVPAPVEPPRPAVSLGFADGSSVNLHADHPAAVALRAVADRLVSAGDEH